jgi:DNA-binding NarL/FixJ family response regulator
VESLGYNVDFLAENGIVAYNYIIANQPNIAILDINMPGMDGLEILEKISKLKMATKVILITMHKEMTIFRRANEFGVSGFILKENALDELQNCLLTVLNGQQYLSKNLFKDLLLDKTQVIDDQISRLSFTEKKILELIAKQKTTKQISELLFIAEKTVEGHRTNIIKKLDLPKEKNVLLKWATKHFDF